MLGYWRVDPQSSVALHTHDPRDTNHGPGKRKATEIATAPLHARLLDLQERLWAEHQRSLLVILQGMDASGKDGTVTHVFQGVNPLGTRAVAFKVPNSTEIAHDFLWRIHAQIPAAGEIGIFNRSQYEDVLVTYVHKLITKDERDRRFTNINNFERLLTDTGTTVVKLFLHISKDEQRVRLQERIDTPSKRWKMKLGDLAERALWDDYQKAYEEVLSKTSSDAAPWYIVPADHKWFRNYAVSTILIDVLKQMNPQHPVVSGFDDVVVEP
jgi:PPK2 family polyphosphate:nucleotide phosphotransferase